MSEPAFLSPKEVADIPMRRGTSSATLRRLVFHRDMGVCLLCGVDTLMFAAETGMSRAPWEMHHVKPFAEGGARLGAENCVTLCKPCHLRITIKHIQRVVPALGQPPPTEHLWLTITQTAVRLRMTNSTVRNYVLAGQLPAKQVNGYWRVNGAFLDAMGDWRAPGYPPKVEDYV